jgi:anti-sigma-K factor RskA
MNDERRDRERNTHREPWRDRFDDLKEAYVLGALTEEEHREFEDYLIEHPELQAEVDDLGAIANLLALAPQEHEPSPELRHNILRRIGGSNPHRGSPSPREVPGTLRSRRARRSGDRGGGGLGRRRALLE